MIVISNLFLNVHDNFTTLCNCIPVGSQPKRETLNKTANWPRGYKPLFMLNPVKHEILNVYKYKHVKKLAFLSSNKPRMLFFPLINVKMPTIVGTLTFMSRKNFMLS